MNVTACFCDVTVQVVCQRFRPGVAFEETVVDLVGPNRFSLLNLFVLLLERAVDWWMPFFCPIYIFPSNAYTFVVHSLAARSWSSPVFEFPASPFFLYAVAFFSPFPVAANRKNHWVNPAAPSIIRHCTRRMNAADGKVCWLHSCVWSVPCYVQKIEGRGGGGGGSKRGKERELPIYCKVVGVVCTARGRCR